MYESEIQLILIDDATDIVLAEETMSPQALPDSFRAETTLNIGGDNWWVVEAEPTTKDEYVASGRLVLRLRRIEKVESQEVRFSLPTLCDVLPPTEGPLIEGTELLLHEDAWRQVEFVASSQSTEVRQQLAIIATILKDGKVGTGFGDLYPRQGSHQPVASADLSLDRLRQMFPSSKESRVAFETSSQTVDRSFALFVTPDWGLYGLTNSSDTVEVLAVARLRPEKSSGDSARRAQEALQALASELDLSLVDWCIAQQAGPEDSAFHAILQEHN